MNFQTTAINKKKSPDDHEQNLRNKINKSSKRTNEMVTSATKKNKTMAQVSVGLGGMTRTYLKKHVTSKRTKHAFNFCFKLSNDFLEVDLAPIF